jgi:hypothetical protein
VKIDCEAPALTRFQALNPEPPDCTVMIPETSKDIPAMAPMTGTTFFSGCDSLFTPGAAFKLEVPPVALEPRLPPAALEHGLPPEALEPRLLQVALEPRLLLVALEPGLPPAALESEIPPSALASKVLGAFFGPNAYWRS